MDGWSPLHAGDAQAVSFSWSDLGIAALVLVLLSVAGVALQRFVHWRRRND
jgi:hypothetical protein